MVRAAGFIRSGHAQLRELLGKFLLVASLRGGRSSAPFRQVQLADELAAVARELQAKAAARRVVIAPEAGSLPMLAAREPQLLRFVLHSLLDNAVAYSAEGATVHVTARPEAGGVLLAVADAGAPIPAETLPALFQPFSKAEGAELFSHEGAGLSLYIDKLIVAYIGGRIAAASDPKQTVFRVWLPGPA